MSWEYSENIFVQNSVGKFGCGNFPQTIVFGKKSDFPKSSFSDGFWDGKSSRNSFRNQGFKNLVSERGRGWIWKRPSMR